jgi:hypothetical protein
MSLSQEEAQRRRAPIVEHFLKLIAAAVNEHDRTSVSAAGQIVGLALTRAFMLEQRLEELGDTGYVDELRLVTPLPGETVAQG